MIIISWNVVSINFHANESLLQHLREKISSLEPYLNDFPADSVHLLIELSRDLKAESYTARLSLRIPKEILRSQQPGKEVQNAFDEALKALLKQLKSQWAALHPEGKKARFAHPMAEGTGLPKEQQQPARR